MPGQRGVAGIEGLVEALARVAPRVGPSSVAERDAFHALRFARSCYDHLAGRLGVALSDAFERRDRLRATEADWVVTPKGRRLFERLNVEWEAPRYRRGLEVTRAGDDALRKHWGVSVAAERRAIAESGS